MDRTDQIAAGPVVVVYTEGTQEWRVIGSCDNIISIWPIPYEHDYTKGYLKS